MTLDHSRSISEILLDNKVGIQNILSGYSFKIFGDDIEGTATGIADVNCLLDTSDEIDYLGMLKIRKELNNLLKTTVNIYTWPTLREHFSHLSEEKFATKFADDKLKTLDDLEQLNSTVPYLGMKR